MEHVAHGIVIVGSTGSIGQQALDVIRAQRDQLQVVGLAAGQNLDLLARQVAEHQPTYVAAPALSAGSRWNGAKVVSLDEICTVPEADRVLIATVGAIGLTPTISAIRSHKTIALANKEVLVMAGELVIAEARRHGATILPVDSEHNAVWQCLAGDCRIETGAIDGPIARIILTASGGAFRDLPLERLDEVTPAEALAHPNWVMGQKVTIDTATLMNKAFEVIEAHWLFGLPYEQIDVVLHRESVVHALVEFVDGSVKAELSAPDMRIPLQHALTYPGRRPSSWPRLRLEELGRLSFAPLDSRRYPCFELALAAAREGGTTPVVLSAADDVAVEKFLAGEIRFPEIPTVIARALRTHRSIPHPSLEEILAVDAEVRRDLRSPVARGTRRA